jgi:hypothetical protein
MVHQVALLSWIKNFTRPCILLSDIGGISQFPEVIEDSLKELIVDYGKAKVFGVLSKLILGNGILPGCAIQLLNGQNGFLHFPPDVVFVLTGILNIWMIPKVQSLLNLAEIRVFPVVADLIT